MDITSFVQGIFTVVYLITVVGMVWIAVGLMTAKKTVRELRELLRDSDETVSRLERDFHIRVDDELKEIYSKVDEIYRDMDSRFDKFENRITKKQLLND
jgi:nitrogen fixation/metabolism regulation signal transduction histidine kinase